MLAQRGRVVQPLVAERLAERVDRSATADEDVPVVVPHLVPEVTEQRPVRLIEAHSQRLPIAVVPLGEVKRDQPVVVTGDDRSVLTGEQVEREAVHRVGVPADDREP